MDMVWANRKPVKVTNTCTGWNIHTSGKTAFVTFSQRVENLDTKVVRETAEARYMEKINGDWKIVNVSVVPKPAR